MFQIIRKATDDDRQKLSESAVTFMEQNALFDPLDVADMDDPVAELESALDVWVGAEITSTSAESLRYNWMLEKARVLGDTRAQIIMNGYVGFYPDR